MRAPGDLTFTPAVELRRLYRSQMVSPLEVMQALLARIDAVNPRVNAVVTLAGESALREARRATARLKRGVKLPPLFGIPVAIKDVTPTRGIRTTYGSKLFETHVPDEDAPRARLLLRRGRVPHDARTHPSPSVRAGMGQLFRGRADGPQHRGRRADAVRDGRPR
jgi:Asp-tRNA(Asn)/Glu-tRNA(Gln) amidotransferase A subunit family amidase